MIIKRFLIIGQLLLIMIASPLLSSSANAQSQTVERVELMIPAEDMIQMLSLRDGSKLMGRITNIADSVITFVTDMGEMNIAIDKIIEIKEVPKESIREGSHWFVNPNTSRLYFAPTGRMLKKGQGYFNDIYLFFPGMAYGITDNVTIGGGMSLFPGVDIGDQLLYFTPKVGVKTSETSSLAAGALILALPEIDDESPLVGILYGVGTFGKPDASLTVGLGYGFVDDEFAEKPMLMVGGEKRFSRRVSFVSENWIIPGADQPLISYGFRFFGEGISVDLALLNTLGDDMIFPGLPYVDFVFNF